MSLATCAQLDALDSRLSEIEAMAGQSLTPQGFAVLPGGLILQWGSVQVTPNAVPGDFNFDVVFPITFPNAVFQVVASAGVATTDLDPNPVWREARQSANVANPTTSGCEVTMRIENAAAQDRQFRYIALGF